MCPGVIWWDFDGTLVSRPFMWSEAGYRILNELVHDHHVSLEELRRGFATGMPWHRPDHAHPDLATPDLWWDSIYAQYSDIFRQYECHAATTADALAAIRADILDAQHYAMFDDVVPVLDRLAASGWHHVIVSNHVPELSEIVKGLGIGHFFDAVVTSGLIGYEKPHPRMFEAALAYVPKGAPVWMVGDNEAADCLPAAAFGAKAILVRKTAHTHDQVADDLWAALHLIESTHQSSPS